MKLRLCVLLPLVLVILPVYLLAAPTAATPIATKHAVAQAYSTMPLSFEPAPTPGQYFARSGGYTISIGATQSSVLVADAKSGSGSRQMLSFGFVNANASAGAQPLEPLPGITNYYTGNDRNKWRLGVRNYAKIRANSIYPGVDVVYYGDQRRLEFDFVVAPGADPSPIALAFSGADKLHIVDGDVVAEMAGRSVHFAKPFAYQTVAGKRSPVSVEYALVGDKALLRIGDYDKSQELIIDPVLSYSTFLGGSQGDTANGIAVDGAGNTYVTGTTCSSGSETVPFPATRPVLSGMAFGTCDAYISKLSFNAGTNVTTLVFTTFIGGSNGINGTSTTGNGIALDSAATPNVYVIGTTNFWSLPGAAPNPSTKADGTPRTAVYNGGDHDAFIMVLNGANGTLVRSTYLGGSDDDQGYAIAVDSQQNVVAVGQTKSLDFPAYYGFQPITETYVAFITKLDSGLHIAAPILPGASAISPRPASGTDTCISGALCPAVPDPNQTYYFFSSVFGGQLVPPVATWPCFGCSYPLLAVGASLPVPYGAITIGTPNCSAGSTPLVLVAEPNSATATARNLNWGPVCQSLTVNSAVPDNGGFNWRILGKPVGPVYATTEAYGVALDPNGDVFAVGGSNTSSLEPANLAWLPGMHYAGTGAWILKLRGLDGFPVYATPLGTNPTDNTQTVNAARAVAVDSQGAAYVVGTADGGIYTQVTSANPAVLGGTDAFVLKMSPSGSGIDYGTYLGGSGNDQGLAVAVDSGGRAYITGSTQSADLPVVNPLYDGNNALSQRRGPQDGYVAQLYPDGTGFVMSAYLGGSNVDQGNAVALSRNGSGNIYLAGNTGSVDFPVKNAVAGQATASGQGDAWVAQVLGSSFPSVSVTANCDPLTPHNCDFKNQVVGSSSQTKTITIRSTGPSFLSITSITATGDFTQTNNCISPLTPAGGTKDTCTVTLTFTPSMMGSRLGTLTIADDAPDTPQIIGLTGQGVLVNATVGPPTIAFGSLTVGTISTPQTVTVTNTDPAQTLTVNSVAVSGDFQVTANHCSTPVAPGGACTISVTFTPKATGSRQGTLVVTGNGSGMPVVVQLSGTGTTPVVALSAARLNFGDVPVRTSSSLTVTLTNTGDGDLNMLGIGVSTQSRYTATNNCGTQVKAGMSCTINVTFTPTAVGVATDTLTITDDASGSPQTVALAGNGCGAIMQVSAGSLSFGKQKVTTTSVAQNVVVTNASSFPLQVDSIVPSGDFHQTNNCDQPIPGNGTCTIQVTFAPTATGSRTGTLSISASNASNGNQTVTLVGNGTAPSASLSLTSLGFGDQAIHVGSAAKSVVLSNIGDASLTILGLTAVGDYSQTNDCGASLPAGQSCTLNVVFTPTAFGVRSGTVTINSDGGNPLSITLSGNGIGGILQLSPASVAFGSQTIAVTSSAQNVTVTNVSPTIAMPLNGISVSGDFSYTTTCGANLAPGAQCAVAVTFTPTAAGARTGTLTVAAVSANSPQTVALNGTGATAGPGGTADFSLSPPTSQVSITAGQSGTFTIGVAPLGGLTQTVTLTCTPPSPATCSVAPATVTMDGTNSQTVTVTVNVPASSGGGSRWASWFNRGPSALPFCLALTLIGGRRRRWRFIALVALGLTLLVCTGCGGGSSSGGGGGGGGMAPGSYSVTVTASYGSGSNAVTHSITVPMQVK